jgi:hypothetical protein
MGHGRWMVAATDLGGSGGLRSAAKLAMGDGDCVKEKPLQELALQCSQA